MEGGAEEDAIYASTSMSSSAYERTFFIVDLSRLRDESDTLENAIVVYRPAADLKKVALWSRLGCDLWSMIISTSGGRPGRRGSKMRKWALINLINYELEGKPTYISAIYVILNLPYYCTLGPPTAHTVDLLSPVLPACGRGTVHVQPLWPLPSLPATPPNRLRHDEHGAPLHHGAVGGRGLQGCGLVSCWLRPLQALSGRLDEPAECVVQHLERIHDSFTFYYKSPTSVMEVRAGGYW